MHLFDSMSTLHRNVLAILTLAFGLLPHATYADEESPSDRQRRDRLAEYLNDCDFVGRYTNEHNADHPPAAERYTIKSCTALDEPEMYQLNVRIVYGAVDSEVPLRVRIVFADQTPVITLDQVWIPGLGTFDARVMIRRDRYAGSWQHDDHGGHLFGVIEQRGTTPAPPE